MADVRRAVEDIVGMHLPIAGLLNNASLLQQQQPTKSVDGWDLTFATNHLGLFALTEALAPHLADGANVIFVASTVEDPRANPGRAVGYRGARYISAEASARGEWQSGDLKLPGADAYATSKQCNLAGRALVLAREMPRLHFNVVTPGLIPTTGLFRGDANATGTLSKIALSLLVPMLMPFLSFLSTPQHAAR